MKVVNPSDVWAPWQEAEHCRLIRGSVPLLISLPHDGIDIPADLRGDLVPAALAVPDTDWHVAQLYDFARSLGASLLRPRWSRYVIDLNRPPDGAALYPGRRETGLCPLQGFDGVPIYRAGHEPDAQAVMARVEHYWRPYHAALQAELARLRLQHGQVLLWEGHSIRSHCPMFFDGRLPDYNVGTADGASCGASVQAALQQVLAASGVSHVVNGRFKGGYITRQYGAPEQGIHAVQMEMAQSSYLDEASPECFQPTLAAPAQRLLRDLLQHALAAIGAAGGAPMAANGSATS